MRIVTILIFSISIILAIFFYPALEKRGGYEKITGISFNVIYQIEKIVGESVILLKIFIIFIGILFFYLSLRNSKLFNIQICLDSLVNESLSTSKKNILIIFIIFLSIGFLFNTLLAERHLLPLIVTILLYNLINFNNAMLLRFILLIYILTGLIYFYYYIYISSSF